MSKSLRTTLSTLIAHQDADRAATPADPASRERLEAALEDSDDFAALLEEHLDIVAAASHVGGHSSHHTSQIN